VLAAVLGRDEPGRTEAFLFAGSLLLTGLALPLALPVLGYGAAGLLARLPRTPVWLELAAARLRHAPGVAPRLVAALTVMIYVVGLGSLGVGLVANDRELLPTGDPDGAQMYQIFGAEPVPTDDLRQVPGTQVVDLRSVRATVAGRRDYVLVGSCADLTGMFRLGAGEACIEGTSYRLEFEPAQGGSPPEPGTELLAAGGTRIPAPEPVLHLSARFNIAQSGGVLITRQAPAATSAGSGVSTAISWRRCWSPG
jgi:hypothetical protein